jgi:hypothetical protein
MPAKRRCDGSHAAGRRHFDFWFPAYSDGEAQGALRLMAGSPTCYPEPGDQSHLNMVRQVSAFRGLGRQCSWKEGWKYRCPM